MTRTFPMLSVLLLVPFLSACPDGAVGGKQDAVIDALAADNPAAETAAPVDAVIPDGGVCAPGHTQCVGSNFLRCNKDGSDWVVVTCKQGTECTSQGCSETVCKPNSAECDDDGMVIVCKPDGSAWGAPQDCGKDSVCKAGQCFDKDCAAGTKECTPTAVLVCQGDPPAWVEVPCGEDRICFKGECVECFTEDHCPAGMSCLNGVCTLPVLSVTTTELPDGQVGTAYTATLAAKGGNGAYAWQIDGDLPAGLSLDAAGTIAGTPAAEGVTTFSATVKDGLGIQASKELSIKVHGKGLTITSKSPLPEGEEGTPYDFQFKALGGTLPLGWMVLSGKLPAGLSLASDGRLSGTPEAHGAFDFTVRVVDAGDPLQVASAPFTLNLKIADLVITGDQVIDLFMTKAVILPLITIVEGIPLPYSQQLQAKGGVKPYTWKEAEMTSIVKMFIPKAGVPTGLTLSASGLLSGSVTDTSSVVEVKIPFVNYTLKGFFFMAEVRDSQDPSDSAQAIFLMPTVPVDLGGLGGLGL